MGRQYRIPAVLAVLVGAFLANGASPAPAAVVGHAYLSSFGSPRTEGEPTRGGQFDSAGPVAVDEATGDVYVADGFRIQKFDSEGNFILAWGFGVNDGAELPEVCTTAATCQQGQPGNAPGQMGKPVSIAVDNSDGPNAGDVYVATIPEWVGHFAGPTAVLRFSSSGTFEREVDGSETPHGVFTSLSETGAIAVDGKGYLWVADGKRMMEFSNAPSNAYIGNSEIPATERPQSKGEYWEEYYFIPVFSLAVNNAGRDLFVYSYYNGWCCGLYTFGPDDSLLNSKASPGWPNTNGRIILTWDPAASQLYAAGWTGGTEVQQYSEELEPIGAPFGSGDLSAVNGVAVDGATGMVYVSDNVSPPQVRIFAPVYLPDVTTEDATGVGHTDATLNGHLAPDARGGGEITSCDFEYGTTESYGSTVPCDQATPMSGASSVSAQLSGLTQEKTYHYRLAATNANGTNYGRDLTFTPHAVFGTTTEAPTNVTATSATLNGSFDPAGRDTHYYFKWGRNIIYGKTAPAPPGEDAGSGSGTVHVSATIEGLTNTTPYHYRLVATNNLGTSQGGDESFVSGPPDPPMITQPGVASLSKDSATVSAQVAAGFGTTMYLVEYGTSNGYGDVSEAGVLPEADDAPHSVSAQLTGLQSGVMYHYRWVATNFGGTVHGVDQTFTTPAVPTVAGGSAASVSDTTAVLRAGVDPNGSSTTDHFEYGISPAYGTGTPESQPIGSGWSESQAGVEVRGLAPSTTYHFRIVATNSIGTSYGPDETFTTAPPPPVPMRTACKKHFVLKHGNCVKRGRGKHKHRRPHHKKHKVRPRHHKRKHHHA